MSPKARKRLIRASLAVAIVYFGIQWILPTRNLNYRLDVTFDVDGVPVTGSGVLHATFRKNFKPLPDLPRYSFETEGEAVIVELPNRSDVFVLLAKPWFDGPSNEKFGRFDYLVYEACGVKDNWDGDNVRSMILQIGNLRGTCDIPKKHLPVMVRFRDEMDPLSIERVYPDHPESTLGEGVKFVGASLTITDALVTNKISNRLKWLDLEYLGRGLTTQAMQKDKSISRFSKLIEHSHFKKEY